MRGNAKHEEEAAAHGVAWIDIVVVNLYAFSATVAKVRGEGGAQGGCGRVCGRAG